MRNLGEATTSGAASTARKAPRLTLLEGANHDRALTTLDDPIETAFFARLVGVAVKTLGARHVLDVGCGSGIPTLAAARAGAQKVLGIDLVSDNVELTRAQARRARLEHRVSALHATWEDVSSGRLELADLDLVVANPPYVPSGHGVVVDGGPTGTRAIENIVSGMPPHATGLALLFGSVSDPLYVLSLLSEHGFEAVTMLVQSVPFGRYTSRPETLTHLKALQSQGKAWFCDGPSFHGGAPHAYLTIGIVAQRSSTLHARPSFLNAPLAEMLREYQEHGSSVVPRELGATLPVLMDAAR